MGISGSWMLYRISWCLVKCSISDSKVSELGHKYKFFTFHKYLVISTTEGGALAGIISAIGYIGFTSSQVLAGAKLASATIDGLNIQTALIVMGVIAVAYTSIGGLKAVIYTDTING
jgi:SSS family solute:Na+ symporter